MTFPNKRAPTAGTDRGARNSGERFHVQSASAEPLLQRLDGVQKAGPGWRSKCPACGGNSRKVSIAERDDRVLINAFCGCPTIDVLSAVGLTWADLHPPRYWPDSPNERRAQRQAIRETGWRSALSVLATEATVARIAAAQTLRGEPLELDDWHRLAVACDRIDRAAAVLIEASSWQGGRA